ncbi:hypothetical protein PIB30_048571 [Stylosanthes scabra]|uniref:SAM domain-containing protein n=1 Tax=Stylosanthes scabra TaxID=79078 RepID=A0ABU6WF69_9FABA|nr:hypothetical protein [Stylosanthes scabra]
MAAEPEILQPPPEIPIAPAPSALEETETVPTTTTTTAAQQQPASENPAPPPLAPKRQRRPSVRLGEIGDQRAAAINHETHSRRPSMPPWSWRIRSKEPSRTTSKARSLTNLPNGGEEIAEFGNKRGKSKRASTATKRMRSNFAPRTTGTTTAAAKSENNNNDNGEEAAYRDFDYEQEDEDYHDESPVHSVHDDDGYFHIGRHTDRARVSENDVVESDSRDGRKCEGVRSWLLELGLSRYAPMFEIHEVDDELLPMLTLEDLKDMGINAVGSRRKMYTAIQKLRKGFP